MTTGMSGAEALIDAKVSNPELSGRPRSSTMTSTPPPGQAAQASFQSVRPIQDQHGWPGATGSPEPNQVGEFRVVFDQKNSQSFFVHSITPRVHRDQLESTRSSAYR